VHAPDDLDAAFATGEESVQVPGSGVCFRAAIRALSA
jgi:hypothetical protein